MASPPRSSKFIEGPLSTTPNETANELLDNILSEMDEFESKRKTSRHRNSHSSSDSLPSPSSTASPTNTSHPQYPAHTSPLKHVEPIDRSNTVKEGRRSINFTRRSIDQELESGGKRRESGSGSGSGSHAADAEEKMAKKFVGRLRALTGGRSRDAKPYPGT